MTNPDDPRTPQERAYDPAEQASGETVQWARPADDPTQQIGPGVPADQPTEQYYTADPYQAYGSPPPNPRKPSRRTTRGSIRRPRRPTRRRPIRRTTAPADTHRPDNRRSDSRRSERPRPSRTRPSTSPRARWACGRRPPRASCCWRSA
ncbi:hypothetical protein P9209_08280 [Prescottella defluvii]|nr:hypothetical protein P9209_08280 [Prescottella defluvii]